MPTIGPHAGRTGATETAGPRPRRRHTGRRAAVLVAGFMLVVSACSDDDDGVSTLPPATGVTTTAGTTATPTTDPTTTEPPTTTAPPTTGDPTTIAPTTTISPAEQEQRIKAQVADAYVAAFNDQERLVTHPPAKNLSKRAARFALVDSPAHDELVNFLRDLKTSDERVEIEDPTQNQTYVETISLNGPPPFREATVTHCTVLTEERVRIRPDGETEIVGEPSGLRSFRGNATMRLTPHGWKHFERIDGLLDAWPGENRCARS